MAEEDQKFTVRADTFMFTSCNVAFTLPADAPLGTVIIVREPEQPSVAMRYLEAHDGSGEPLGFSSWAAVYEDPVPSA